MTQQAKLTAADTASGDQFGVSVSIDGDTAIVGAYLDDGTALDSGSAYVFTRTGTTWTQQAKLIAADGAGNDQFGVSVSISGDTTTQRVYIKAQRTSSRARARRGRSRPSSPLPTPRQETCSVYPSPSPVTPRSSGH